MVKSIQCAEGRHDLCLGDIMGAEYQHQPGKCECACHLSLSGIILHYIDVAYRLGGKDSRVRFARWLYRQALRDSQTKTRQTKAYDLFIKYIQSENIPIEEVFKVTNDA